MSGKPPKKPWWKILSSRPNAPFAQIVDSSGPSAGTIMPPAKLTYSATEETLVAGKETLMAKKDNRSPIFAKSNLTPSQPISDALEEVAPKSSPALSQSARKWLKAAQVSLDLFSKALTLVPVPGLGVAVALASKALAQVEAVATNADDLQKLANVVSGLQKSLFPDPEHLRPLPKYVDQRIQSTLKNLGLVESSAKEEESKGYFNRYFNASLDATTIVDLFKSIQNGLNEFMVNGVLNTEINVWDLLKNEEQKSLESSLQNVFLAQWDKLDPQIVECMTGTREDILESIYQWRDTPDTESICWLRGLAGVGKTTIAKSVCKNTTTSKQTFGGSFFCSRRGDAALRDVSRIFPSLALQLCKNVPGFHEKLLSTWNRLPSISDIPSAPADQFVTLILNPLKDTSWTTVILVVDALDECSASDAAEQIFESISNRIAEVPHLKILVTSRPETEILTTVSYLEVPPHTLILPRENHQDRTKSDLTLFFTNTLQELANKHRARDRQPPNFPSDKLVADLVHKAQGSFIYARIVCNSAKNAGLSYRDVATHFANVEHSNHTGLNHIYELYDLILRKSIERTGNLPAEKELLYSILGAIIHLQSPLSISDLASLMGFSVDNVFKHLDRIRSILYLADTPDSPAPVQTMHATLGDFLVGQGREGRELTLPVVDPAEQHRKITLRTYVLMNKLVRNPCRLDRFTFNPTSEIVSKHISGSLSYSCQYWADHLNHCIVGTTKGDALLNATQQFAATKLLVWIEACSLLGHVDSVIHSLHIISQNKSWASQLERLQVLSAEKTISVLELLQDAYRLASTYSEPLHHHAAQLYLSAFKMLPAQSPIRHQYLVNISVDEGMEFQHGRRPNWDPCLHVWTIPGGKLVAVVPAASAVNYVGVLSRARAELSVTIWVWDMAEGSLKWSKRIADVQDSDNVGLYSSQRDFILVLRDTVTMFDFITGIASRKADYFDVVRVIPGFGLYFKTSQEFISVDSGVEPATLLATSSLFAIPKTSNVYAMDPAQFALIQAYIEKGYQWTHDIRWSDCGRFFAASIPSPDPNLRLAIGRIPDEATQTKDIEIFVEFPSIPHLSPLCTALSHEESNNHPQYAVCAGDKIQIWCTKTRSLIAEFIGHHRQTDFVSFSHDNQYVVSGSGNVVKVWDWQRYTSESPADDFPRDHDLWLQSVSFSEDGKQFISSSWDRSIVLWKEVENNTFQRSLTFKTDACPLQASFAPGGDVAYVLSEEGMGYGIITFWDPLNQSNNSEFSWNSRGFTFSPTSSNKVHRCVTRHEDYVEYFQCTEGGCFEWVADFPVPVDIAFSPAGTLALVYSRKIFLYSPQEAIPDNESSEVRSQSDKLHQYDYDGKLYVSRNRIFLHHSDSVGDGELVWVTVSDEGDEIVEELKLDKESKGFYMRGGWIVRGDGKVYAWTPRSYGRGICHDIYSNRLLLGGEDGQISLLKIG